MKESSSMLTLTIIFRRAMFLLLAASCYLGLYHTARIEGCAQGTAGRLELEQMPVTLPKNHDAVIRGRYVIPPEDVFPNTAFVVVDGANAGAVVVRGIAYFLQYSTPSDLLTGKLIWNEGNQQDLLVTLKAMGRHARFRIFQVDPHKEIGKYPLKLDAGDFRKWPDELPVLGTMDIDISKDAGCLLKELNVLSRDRNLELTVRRERADRTKCEPLTQKFYLDSLMWSGESLASLSYQAGSRSGRLELVKTPLKLPVVEEQARYFKDTRRELPNWVYVLTDYPEQAGAAPRTIWFGYASATSLTTRDVLVGSLAWDATNRSGYVVTVNSGPSNGVIKVYRVELSSMASAHPFELNRNEYRKWPQDASPLAQKTIDLSGCQLNSANASLAKDELVISLGRVEGGCASTRLSLNLKTSQWTEIK
jgi:hypothetical protein